MAQKKQETPKTENRCKCGNSLFPRQFRCEKCGEIQPMYIEAYLKSLKEEK